MLILTRKIEEAIVIGDDIVIRILKSRSWQTRLGISAPRDVSVHRHEVYERIHGHLPCLPETSSEKSGS